MQRIILWCFCLFLTNVIVAQKYSLKGQVQDEEKINLIGATVVALDPIDSTLMGYTVTDVNGMFLIKGLSAGKYNIQFTYISYGTIQRLIELAGENKIKDLGIITMFNEGKMLETVTITSDYVPIKVTKDTIEFNADAFKTQPNAVVEDLLRKLPGVEIDADGGIKVQGEDVKAVTVDGRDFFGKDPKMATKNLPANAIKKVQIFDKKSKTATFTGVEDGQDEKTINLELKDNKKSGYFGNAMAGYGTNDRYEGKIMLNRFNKKTQFSFIGSLNNLNNTGVNVSDFSSMTSGNTGGNNFNTNAPVSFGQNNTGVTRSMTTGLNVNYDLGKKNKLNFSYFITNGNTKLIQTSLTDNFVQTNALISEKSLQSKTSSLNHNFYTTIDLKLDSTTEMTIISSLTARSSNDVSNQMDTTLNRLRTVLNLNDQAKENKVSSNIFAGQVNYRKRLSKKGRNFTLDGSFGNNTNNTLNQILSEVYDPNLVLNLQRSVFQFQDNNSGNKNFSFGGSYTEPLSQKWFLTLNYAVKNNKSDLIKDFFNVNPENTTIRTFNEELSRAFDNRFLYYNAGSNFRYKHVNFISNVGIEYQQSKLDGIPSVGLPINRKFNYFLPRASIDFEKTNIRINYTTTIREPSIDQLQPIIDNSDPLNLYVGNPSLVPEYRHNMRISYNFFDQYNFRSLFASLRLGYTKDRITTASFVDEFFIRRRTPRNTSSEQTMASNVSYSSPLNFMKAKFRAGLNSSLTRGINFINLKPNDIDRWSNGWNLLLENKSKDRFDVSIGSRWSINNNIYKDNKKLNSNYVNQTYEAYLAIFPGKGWTVDTRLESSIYGQGSFDTSTKINLWQASISKSFLDNKVTAKLRIFDILNQNQGVNRSASETFISETISNSIGRYVMVNVIYSLNALGAPKPSQDIQMHMMRR
ncbi:MAG: outer membrane beta-barrel protein [Saprospiraceae bacterium]|nr:outer membrane beta-barrel protein [Saprospiraceae bacterium]